MQDYEHTNGLQRGLRRVAALRPVSWVFARTLHHLDRPVSRWTHGRVTVTSLTTGLTATMLTTTGARSGQRRTVPVLAFAADPARPVGDLSGDVVVIASNFAQGHHPAWYHNLLAHPEAELLVDGAERPVRARLSHGDERDRLWARGVQIYPGWRAYAARSPEREIGVFLLSAR